MALYDHIPGLACHRKCNEDSVAGTATKVYASDDYGTGAYIALKGYTLKLHIFCWINIDGHYLVVYHYCSSFLTPFKWVCLMPHRSLCQWGIFLPVSYLSKSDDVVPQGLVSKSPNV